MSLSKRALLASLTISQWSGRKYDRRANGTVEASYNAQQGAGNYTKKLLPGAKELAEVNRIAGTIRQFFYEQSHPWATDGSRIIASQNYLDFVNEFRTLKSQFDEAVSSFLQAYPALREAAKVKLGNLFNETEYPTPSQLQRSFGCEISFMPIPEVGDFRVEVLDEEKRALVDTLRQVEQQAARECWNRLYGVVSKAAHKLSQPDPIFRDSLLDNVKEMCELLPKLNVTDDAELETVRQNVEKALANMDAKAIRVSEHARTEAVRKLDDITNRMASFMGYAGNRESA